MLEVNAIYVILLAEGLGVSILLTLLMVWMRVRTYNRNLKAVKQLILQIKHQSKNRTEKTGHFLKQIYHLEDDELKQAVATIDKQERGFFQKIIRMFLYDDTEIVISIDAALAELIDTYKELKPKNLVVEESGNQEEMLAQIGALKAENEKLIEKVAITNRTMEGMIGEFGNMFGGGKDHELAKHEVVKKVVEK